MEIVDLSKAVRRKTDSRRHELRRANVEGNSLLARIAKLQRALDARARTGDTDGFIAGRRELCSLIFTVMSEDLAERSRK